jgi:hypothetical protein
VFTFDITPDATGETVRVVATSRDVSHWERTGKGRSIAALERDARMSQLEEIAYLAATRRAAFAGTLEEFRAGVDILPIDTRTQDDGEEGDGESGPTLPAR